MNIVSSVVTYGISNIWTGVILLWLYYSLFTPESTSKYLAPILLVIYTCLTTIINIFSTAIEISMIASFIVIFLISICYTPKLQAVFIGFYFFFVHLLIEDAVVIVFSLLGHVTYDAAMNNDMITRILLMLVIEVLFLTCILFVKSKIKIIQDNKRYFSYWSISFSLVAILLLILHFTTIIAVPNERIGPSQLVNVVIFFSIIHFLLMCLSRIIRFDIIKAENRQLQAISQYYADRMQESIEAQNHDRILKHDLKKVFYAIQVMADNQDIEGIKESAACYSDKLTSSQIHKANTGIPEIDNITNHLLSGLDKDVTCTFTSVVNEDLRINSQDCIVLLGNLLENAIEAVQQVSFKKIINIKVTLDRNIFHLEIVNSYIQNLQYDSGGNLLTTKADHNEHGYGLRSIENIVKKYDGTSDFLPIDSNTFSSSVILFQVRS